MNYSRLIDDYLLGNLSEKNRKAFEAELAINPRLRKEVKLCMELKESIYEDDVFALREKLNISQKAFYKAKISKRAMLISLVSAASLLLIFGLKIFFVDNTPNYEKLYHKHFQPYKILGDSRGDNQSKPISHFDDGVKLYTIGEYEQVTPLLEKRIARDSNDFELILMLTTAYLETNNAEKAEKILSKIEYNRNNIAYTETLDWYLVLSILRQGRIEEAQRIFEKIAKDGGLYSKKALSILESLEKKPPSNRIDKN